MRDLGQPRLQLGRYTAFLLCIALAVLGVAMRPHHFWGIVLASVPVVLVVIGVRDLVQRHHAVLRNYPVIGHVRWLAEMIRPEIRQYLLEDDEAATPFSRAQRSLVYRRAKSVSADQPFGDVARRLWPRL